MRYTVTMGYTVTITTHIYIIYIHIICIYIYRYYIYMDILYIVYGYIYIYIIYIHIICIHIHYIYTLCIYGYTVYNIWIYIYIYIYMDIYIYMYGDSETPQQLWFINAGRKHQAFMLESGVTFSEAVTCRPGWERWVAWLDPHLKWVWVTIAKFMGSEIESLQERMIWWCLMLKPMIWGNGKVYFLVIHHGH